MIPIGIPPRWGLLASVLLVVGCAPAGGASPTPHPAADELVIVTPTAALAVGSPGSASERRYVVQAGDSLSALALRFGVTEEALGEANGIDDPDGLLIGQELVIPASAP